MTNDELQDVKRKMVLGWLAEIGVACPESQRVELTNGGSDDLATLISDFAQEAITSFVKEMAGMGGPIQ